MGIRADVIAQLERFTFTKIDGQPTDEDLNLLVEECTTAASSVLTRNGGGEHGHVGIILEEAEYIAMSNGGAKYVTPTNPGAYPATVDENDAIARERQIAEHKMSAAEYETHLAVESFMRERIVECIDPEWLAQLKSTTMGFNHRKPLELIDHLRSVGGGDLDHMDVTELTKGLLKEWDGIETPASFFARGDRYERQLEKAGQTKNPELRLAFALSNFEASGQFEAPLREWNARTKRNKTFATFRPFIQKEFAQHHKHNKATAKSVGHGIANTVTEAQTREADIVETTVMAVAEIANVMQQKQDEQFDKMLKMFKTIIDAKNVPAPTPPNPNPNGKKKKMCPHCKMEVFHPPEKCFELEANASKRPANWKSKLST